MEEKFGPGETKIALTSYLIGLIVPICSVCNVTFGYCPMYTNAQWSLHEQFSHLFFEYIKKIDSTLEIRFHDTRIFFWFFFFILMVIWIFGMFKMIDLMFLFL